MRTNSTKKIISVLLAVLMIFSTAAATLSVSAADVVTIKIQVFDHNKVYVIGTDTCKKKASGIQSEDYVIPTLTKWVKADKYGTVEKVVGNWYFPVSDSWEGRTVQWSNNSSTGTMTYWVDEFDPSTSSTGSDNGTGTGSTGSSTVNIGESGNKNWSCKVVYHSNYPSGTDFVNTVSYNVTAYTTIYNITPTLASVGFSVPEGYAFKGWSTSKTAESGSSNFTLESGKTLTLYAVFESTSPDIPSEPAESATVTYISDGESNSVSCLKGESVILPTYTKEGYSFKGWAASENGEVAYEAGSSFTVNADVTVYAVWEAVVAPHEHSFTSTVTTPATCTEDGVMTYSCDCGYSYDETIVKTAHADENSDGICDNCNESIGHVHTPDTYIEPSPDCQNCGYKYVFCTVCDEELSFEFLEPGPHSFGEWVITTPATIISEGEKERVCTLCGAKETEVIDKLPSETVTDEESGISLTYGEGAFDGSIVLDIDNNYSGTPFGGMSGRNIKYWNITIMKDGEEVQPSEPVYVKIPIPEGFNRDSLKVYHYKTSNPPEREAVDFTIEGDYVCFYASSFSPYAVADESTDEAGSTTSKCICLCHAKGLAGFLWKIFTLIKIVFGMNPERTCVCGEAHM